MRDQPTPRSEVEQPSEIPMATGTYFAASRGLIEQPAFQRLPVNARVTLYTLERMLPASAAAPLHEPLVATYATLDPEDLSAALADLEAVGWLIRAGDWWVMPHLLDLVNGSARGRVIGETRDLPEDVQAILRARWPWVMGRRGNTVDDPTAARARAPVRNKPTNQPTNPEGARERDREPIQAPVTRASTSPEEEDDPPTPRTGGVVSQGGGYCLASEWERAFRLAGRAVPAEPKAKSPKPYRDAVLGNLPHETEEERDDLFRAMEAWAREGGGGVAAFVAAESKSREAGERERAYRARHGLQDGPLFPVLSQRELDAGITEFPAGYPITEAKACLLRERATSHDLANR